MAVAPTSVVALLKDEPVLTENARKVLEARYLKKNEAGACVEKPGELFGRVARVIADIERQYGANEAQRRHWEDRFYNLMTSGAFMPNSPTLMNAGREMGMLSACFVLPVRDSIIDIFNSIKHTAMIQKAGGGTGFAFDELRPTGDYIASSGGTTSGPITFWRAFSEATNAIQQGAFRRGANMGMMYIHHPDILKFLHAKQDLNQFTNYNISVKVTDAWMDEFLTDPDSPHVVRNPRTGQAFVLPKTTKIWEYTVRDLVAVDCVESVLPTSKERYFRTPRLTGAIPAELEGQVYTKREIWDIIVQHAWQTGEPGVIFIDRINEHNPTPHVGRIEATNPCGEQPLLPYEACNLGSVNLGVFIKNGCTPAAEVDWDGLRVAVHESTRFLDNVIDANNYPLDEIDAICKANRKIGLGVMGFADALYKLSVPYNSDAGVAWGERFMKFLNDEAHNYSEQLARERGPFPNWKGSLWHTRHNRLMRNSATTTVAPTGTISIIANCSGGIEPMFSLAFIRNVLKGQKQGDKPLVEVNDTFRDVARARGFLSDALLERIAREGTLHHMDEVPADVKDVFVCAHDITPEWHMKMQAAFQRHCDASISKTINFPNAASVADVNTIYMLAFQLGCKGVTVYRDGCRDCQPMALKKEEGDQAEAKKETSVPAADKIRTEAKEPQPAAVEEHDSVDFASDEIELPATRRIAPQPIEAIDLPEIVSGLRIRQQTPFGNMHVKITVDPVAERELEIFAQLGKGGDVANSDLEGLCRIASLWLRAGGSLKALIKQWEGIGSSMQIPTRVGRIMSLPDGLACALKKYQQAKERFGLRGLLLGEVNLAALDTPPAPHDRLVQRADKPLVAPVPTPTHGGLVNGGNGNGGHRPGNGNGGNGHANGGKVVAVERRMEAAVANVAPTAKAAIAKTRTLRAAANDEAVVAAIEEETAVAVLDTPEAVDEALASAVEHAEAEAQTATDERMKAATNLAEVLAAVSHRHDAATHYKVKCPECGGTLALQEGCRKCHSCGWSAC